jgi:hypothetical protein
VTTLHRLTLREINENPTLMSDEVFVPAEEVDALIAVVKAQHHAIDELFARLIELTSSGCAPQEVFYPSKCGQPWEAIHAGKAVLDAAGVKL